MVEVEIITNGLKLGQGYSMVNSMGDTVMLMRFSRLIPFNLFWHTLRNQNSIKN